MSPTTMNMFPKYMPRYADKIVIAPKLGENQNNRILTLMERVIPF